MRIYLGDLGHNQVTVTSDIFPLGIANLAAYLQEYGQITDPLEISLFREPLDLKSVLDSGLPDVLALSSYAWNHELALSFARYAKNIDAGVLTLMGGPNFPLTEPEQERMLREMPCIDVAVRGPTYEGERAFRNVIHRYWQAGLSREGLMEERVAGSLWIHPRTGEMVRGAEVERIENLDEIPSPYIRGWLDSFFSTGYFPSLQIARGCPFSCAFCNSSVESNNRIFSHSIENIREDLRYIAARVKKETPLCFADDNFGMYSLDEEVADFIAYLQDEFGWPRYLRTTTGKNRGDRIIRVMRKMRGILPMTSAVQSMNPAVLQNIKRSNIKLSTYAQIQKEVEQQGMQSYGELILCLPGETRESFMNGIQALMEAGVKRVSAHQLMLIHGAPLSNPDSRDRFGLKSKFRIVARDIGNYTGDPVMEVEEMVVETPTMSFADYLHVRVFLLLSTTFYHEGIFEEAFEFARLMGIPPFLLISTLQERLPLAPPAFQETVAAFLAESQSELFETKEACIQWARANFQALVSGSLGGNLLYNYSMLGRFFKTEDSLKFLDATIRSLIPRSSGRSEELEAVMSYLRCVVMQAPFSKSMHSTTRWNSLYDVERWRQEGYKDTLECFRFPTMQSYIGRTEPEQRAQIENRISIFGEHPAGLGKFTRSIFLGDLRRKLQPESFH